MFPLQSQIMEFIWLLTILCKVNEANIAGVVEFVLGFPLGLTRKNEIQEPCRQVEEFADYTKADNGFDKSAVGDPSITEPWEEKIVLTNRHDGLNKNIFAHVNGLS